jgi:hypothetical protein
MLGGEGGIAGRVLRERADPEALRRAVIEGLAPGRPGPPRALPLEGATAERLPSAGVTGPYVGLPSPTWSDAGVTGFEVADVEEACAAVARAGGRVVAVPTTLGGSS